MATYSDMQDSLDDADFVEEYEVGNGKRRVKRKFGPDFLRSRAMAEGLAARRNGTGAMFKGVKIQEPSE